MKTSCLGGDCTVVSELLDPGETKSWSQGNSMVPTQSTLFSNVARTFTTHFRPGETLSRVGEVRRRVLVTKSHLSQHIRLSTLSRSGFNLQQS